MRCTFRSALELYLEEAECLATFFKPPVILNDLRVLLDQVAHEASAAKKRSEEVGRQHRGDGAGSSHQIERAATFSQT